MTRPELKLMKIFACLFLVFALINLCGCGQPENSQKEQAGPVFFPPAPDTPRLQFLTSYSGADNFKTEKASFLETFVLGESELGSAEIVQPYGITAYENKIYVCDIGQGNIKVMDIANNTFSTFPSGRTLKSPMNIFIEPNGMKYIADSKVGAIVVYNKSDELVGYLGRSHRIKPFDVAVRGNKVYVSDANNNQVIVLDKKTGDKLQVIGKSLTENTNYGPDEFGFIACLGLDSKGNVFVTDKIKGRVTAFNPDGSFRGFYGRVGSRPDSIVRGKGMAFDKKDRLWVVDAGPANAVKIFRHEDGRFLLFFGLLGDKPGNMYMPADVYVDYDHIDYYKKFAVKGADLECIIFVTNQYGPNKVSVYGLGTFPTKYKLDGVLTKDETERIAE